MAHDNNDNLLKAIVQSDQTDCFVNGTQKYELDRDDLDDLFRVYFGLVPLPLILLAIPLTTIYFVAVIKAIRSRHVSRKCYVLLLNRTLGDIICCGAALATSIYVVLDEHPKHDTISGWECLFMSSFWSAMVSYVSLSAIKLYAVSQPLQYRKVFTMRRCIYLAVLSWVIFALIMLVSFTMAALVKVPVLNRWSGCRLETCIRMAYVVRHYAVIVMYLCTVVFYSFTVVFVKRAAMSTKRSTSTASESSEKRMRFPFWKLSCNMFTFTGTTTFYVLYCIRLLSQNDRCYFLKHALDLLTMLGLVRCAILFRILIDPIISFVTDDKISQKMLATCGASRKVTFSLTRGLIRRGSTSAFNSSLSTATPRRQTPNETGARSRSERTHSAPSKFASNRSTSIPSGGHLDRPGACLST